MKSGLGRVAAVVTAMAIAVVGAGSAVAGEPASARDGAAAVQELHDDLAMAAEAGDVPAARWTLTELQPLLTELATGERYAVEDGSRSLAGEANTAAADALSQVDQQFGAKVDLPPPPALLNALLQTLLDALSDLLNQLLGELPLPLPVPDVPAVP